MLKMKNKILQTATATVMITIQLRNLVKTKEKKQNKQKKMPNLAASTIEDVARKDVPPVRNFSHADCAMTKSNTILNLIRKRTIRWTGTQFLRSNA